MNRRGQFWLIAIVLAYLAIVTLFFYVRSADRSSVNLFEPNSDLDLQNMINAIKIRNTVLAGAEDWYDLSWQYRRRISVPITGGGVEVPTGIEAGKVTDCIVDIRATYLNNSEFYSNVSATAAPGCNLTMGVPYQPFTFYVYYGNAGATIPNYRKSVPQQGVEAPIPITPVGSEVEVPTRNLCTHFNPLYPRLGMQLNCSLVNLTCSAPSTRANISLVISANDLKYNGTIGASCPSVG
jgi:hypothetical protein